MSEVNINRKIAVIFATDVVGYSKHMELNEDETLRSFRACRRILEALFEKYEGRTFNTAGDSVLAEFPSAVSAVVCASEFQKLIKERNESKQSHTRLQFRIGINMGDVVIEEDNLFGDGVNIAARLEALAQPNGICLSKSVYDLVNKKIAIVFNDLGQQKVKDSQVHAFDVLLDPSQKRNLKVHSKYLAKIFVFMAALFIFSISTYFYFTRQLGKHENTFIEIDEFRERVLGRTLLIAPFENKSGSKEFDYIAEGISDHLISSLTSHVLLNILPKSQSYKIVDQNFTANSMINTHNVSYLLTGTTLISNNKFRLNLELLDIHDERIIWTDNQEYIVDKIFDAQDSIELSVLRALQKNLTMGAILSGKFAKNFQDPNDYKKILNLRYVRHGENFFVSNDNELPYEDLLFKQPDNSMLNYLFAKSIYMKLINYKSNDRKKDIKTLKNILEKSIELNPENSMPYALLGLTNEGHMLGNFDMLKGLQRQRSDAIKLVKKALELGSRNVETLFYSGMFYKMIGKYSNAITLFEKAIKLAPFGPEAMKVNLLSTHLLKLDFDRAEELAESIMKQGDKRSIFIGSMFLTYIKVKKNKVAEATTDFQRILSLYKYDKEEAIFQIRRYGQGTFSWFNEEFKTVMEKL